MFVDLRDQGVGNPRTSETLQPYTLNPKTGAVGIASRCCLMIVCTIRADVRGRKQAARAQKQARAGRLRVEFVLEAFAMAYHMDATKRSSSSKLGYGAASRFHILCSTVRVESFIRLALP